MSDEPAPEPSRRSSSISPMVVVAALLGAVLFAYTIRQTGPTTILDGLHRVGWGFLVVLALSGMRFVFRAWAWSLCTEGPARLGIRDTFPAMLTGDALGNLTPLGLFVSEPTKAVFVQHRVPLMTAVSGIAIENLLYTLTVSLMIAGGTVALLLSFTVTAALEYVTIVAAAGMVAVLGVTAWVLGRQVRIVTPLIDWLHRRQLAPAALALRLEKLQTLEAAVYGFHVRHPHRLLPVLGLEGAYHAAGVVEVYVTLSLLTPPPTWLIAFILESVNRLINVVFKFVPMRLGVDEFGTKQFADVLGYSGDAAVTLALVRKIRMLFWTAIGLAFLARRGLGTRLHASDAVTLSK